MNPKGNTMAMAEAHSGTRSQMYPLNLFVYNSYWGTWSRVLRHLSPQALQVEVNVTGSRSTYDSWNKTAQVWIRAHCTARGARDLVVADLPHEVTRAMQENLREVLRGSDCDTGPVGLDAHVQRLMHTLLHDDLLNRIDWDKYKKIDNGGACFYDVQKD